jgi:hypothetical protein
MMEHAHEVKNADSADLMVTDAHGWCRCMVTALTSAERAPGKRTGLRARVCGWHGAADSLEVHLGHLQWSGSAEPPANARRERSGACGEAIGRRGDLGHIMPKMRTSGFAQGC